MKALRLLIALSLLYNIVLFADNKSDNFNNFISKNKIEQFSYDYKKIEVDTSKLRDSWIAPLNLQYSYVKSNPYSKLQNSQNAAIKMDQPIFQSGGIYYGIKFAEASRVYANYSVDVAKRKLIKDAIALLMQIKQSDFRINKQNLQIKNSEINLKLKKEQYLNGQLDSGFLDNAIIERNILIQALYDIQTNKERLVSKFKTISDISYESVKMPHLELLSEDEFLANNIALKMSESDSKKTEYNKDITTSKYLPKVSFTAGYNWSKSENNLFQFGSNEKNYYDYGVKAYLPIDINTFRDVESSRIAYLKSKVILKDKKRELKALFEQVMQNINNLDKKRLLSVENKEIYEKLLLDTRNLFQAGYKTEYDVELLENSVKIQEINSGIFEIDKQLELLTLYEMYKNEI